MHIQRLKLPHQKVKEEMHLQENILFDFRPLVTRNIAQYPIHHMTYLATKFEVATSNGLGGVHNKNRDRCMTWPRSAVGNVSINRCKSD